MLFWPTVADATGKPESGLLDGNGFYEGRAPLCRRANERLADEDIVMTPHWCGATYDLLVVGEVFEEIEAVNATRTDWVRFEYYMNKSDILESWKKSLKQDIR